MHKEKGTRKWKLNQEDNDNLGDTVKPSYKDTPDIKTLRTIICRVQGRKTYKLITTLSLLKTF